VAHDQGDFLLPLAAADRIYRWDRVESRLHDLTAPVRERLTEKNNIQGTGPSPVMVYSLAHDQTRTVMQNIKPGPGGALIAEGQDPFLVFKGFSFVPMLYDQVEIIAALHPISGPVVGNICIYWANPKNSAFDEERKSCLSPRPGNDSNQYLFPVGDDPDWIMTSSVDTIRFDPGESPVRLELEQIRVITAPQP
jgi:hypothetical protein